MSAVSTSPRGARRRRAFVAWLGSHAMLILACAVVIAPIYFLVLGSFKSVEEFFSAPFGLPHTFGTRELPARLDRGVDLDDDQEQRDRDRFGGDHQHRRLVPRELRDRPAAVPGKHVLAAPLRRRPDRARCS